MTIRHTELPHDVEHCHALLHTQAATIASQAQKLEELASEMEKLRGLLNRFLNGHRSERRILPAENQPWLPFESSEEFQAARAEAAAEAEAIVQTYTVTRSVTKKKRNESLPANLPRVEKVVEGDDAQKNCPTHGLREVIGYDTTETLVYKRPELYVLVRKYPKYACPGYPGCGVASPERPTSLVEGDRYDTSVAAAVIEAKWFQHLPIYRHQDLFAGSGCPSWPAPHGVPVTVAADRPPTTPASRLFSIVSPNSRRCASTPALGRRIAPPTACWNDTSPTSAPTPAASRHLRNSP